MYKNNEIDYSLNLAGIDLTIDEVDSVLNLDDNTKKYKREGLAIQFSIEIDKLSKQMLTRYAEADKVMTRISLGPAHHDIHRRLIDTLQSTKRCYSHAEYTACIELCALYGEMLANYLCIADKDKLIAVIDDMDGKNKKIIKRLGTSDKYFADAYSQSFRLKWLEKSNIIDVHDKVCLLHVHNLRIKYFHHWNTNTDNAKSEALDALARISSIASKYLETLGAQSGTYNQENRNRISRYMTAVANS